MGVITVDGPPFESALHKQPGWAQAIVLVIGGFLPILAIVSLAPAVPVILDHFRGVANAGILVPMMVSAPGLMIALLAPLMGLLADRIGRRPILLWATLFYGVFGLAPFFIVSLSAVIGSRLLLGITEAAILTVVNTLIADYFDTVWRRRVLTIQAVVGPILGTAVISASGVLTERIWNGAFLIYSVAFAIFIWMVISIFEPHREKFTVAEASVRRAAAAPFPWKAVSTFALVTLFSATLYYVFIIQGGLAFRAVGVTSPTEAGVRIAIASIGVPIGGLLFGFLSKRLSPALMVTSLLAFLGVGLLGIGLAHDVTTMTVVAILQQIGAGLTVPSLIFWAQGVLPFEQRGRGMGIWSAAFFLGQFTSPMLVGLVGVASGSLLATFATMGSIALIGAAVALVVGLRQNKMAIV